MTSARQVGNGFPVISRVTPGKMSDNELGAFVADGAVRIAVFCEQLKPFYLDLRNRFAKKPKKATIHKCRTWDEYCTKVLDRTKRAVNYFLAGGNPVAKRALPDTKVKIQVERVPNEEKKFEVCVQAEPAVSATPSAPAVLLEQSKSSGATLIGEKPVAILPIQPEPEGSSYTIWVTLPKGGNIRQIQAAMKSLPPGSFEIEKDEVPSSRANRLNTAIEGAQGEVAELKQELESWKENLPENLQDSQKAQELETAIEQLDEVIRALDEASTAADSVEFPGMF